MRTSTRLVGAQVREVGLLEVRLDPHIAVGDETHHGVAAFDVRADFRLLAGDTGERRDHVRALQIERGLIAIGASLAGSADAPRPRRRRCRSSRPESSRRVGSRVPVASTRYRARVLHRRDPRSSRSCDRRDPTWRSYVTRAYATLFCASSISASACLYCSFVAAMSCAVCASAASARSSANLYGVSSSRNSNCPRFDAIVFLYCNLDDLAVDLGRDDRFVGLHVGVVRVDETTRVQIRVAREQHDEQRHAEQQQRPREATTLSSSRR